MFAKKVSVYAGLERRERPNCISEKCIKCAPKSELQVRFLSRVPLRRSKLQIACSGFFQSHSALFPLLLRFPATASLLRGPHWQAANRLLRLFSKPQRALLRCPSVSPPQLRFCGGPIGKLQIACSGFFQSHSALFYAAPPFPRHSFAFAGALSAISQHI